MEIITGIKLGNKVSPRVKSWSDIKDRALELQAYLNEQNGTFKGEWTHAYALHECQVRHDHKNFFVLEKNIAGDVKVNAFAFKLLGMFKIMPSIIINPEILDKPEKVVRTMPEKVTKHDDHGKVTGVEVQLVERELSNLIYPAEACMSFPKRTKKTMPRYYEIKVRFQTPIFNLFLVTVTKTVSGLSSHIFQHEYDHSQGSNIYFGDRIKGNG